jgi:hypothetical protein
MCATQSWSRGSDKAPPYQTGSRSCVTRRFVARHFFRLEMPTSLRASAAARFPLIDQHARMFIALLCRADFLVEISRLD